MMLGQEKERDRLDVALGVLAALALLTLLSAWGWWIRASDAVALAILADQAHVRRVLWQQCRDGRIDDEPELCATLEARYEP